MFNNTGYFLNTPTSVASDIAGTTSSTFIIDTDGASPVMLKNNAGVLEIRNGGDTAYADLIVANLTVDGTITSVDIEEIHLEDSVIILNFGSTVSTQNAGIEVAQNTTNASLLFDASPQVWKAGLKGSEKTIILESNPATLGIVTTNAVKALDANGLQLLDDSGSLAFVVLDGANSSIPTGRKLFCKNIRATEDTFRLEMGSAGFTTSLDFYADSNDTVIEATFNPLILCTTRSDTNNDSIILRAVNSLGSTDMLEAKKDGTITGFASSNLIIPKMTAFDTNGLQFLEATNGNGLYIQDATGYVGVNCSDPNSGFCINGTTSIAGTINSTVRSNTATACPYITGSKSRGDFTTPDFCQNSDWLSVFGTGVWNGTESQIIEGLLLQATENHSATNLGCAWRVYTVPNGSTAIAHRMTIDQNGNVGIGATQTNPSQKLSVEGNVNVTSGNDFLINGVSINTAGTLSNVAYENQANSFTANQTITTGNYLVTEEVRALGATGLKLTDDAGTLGLTIEDGGNVSVASGKDLNVNTIRAYSNGTLTSYFGDGATSTTMKFLVSGGQTVMQANYNDLVLETTRADTNSESVILRVTNSNGSVDVADFNRNGVITTTASSRLVIPQIRAVDANGLKIVNDGAVTCATATDSGAFKTRGRILEYSNKTTDYTTTATDHVISVTTSTIAVTITLDSAAAVEGTTYVIKDTGNATTYNVIVAPNNSKTIDGQATYTINQDYNAITVIYDGTNWLII